MNREQPDAVESVRAAASPRRLSVELDTADSAGRPQLESCIADKFAQQYGAKIQHFLPYLLSLNDSRRLNGVVGIRLAAESELFLERYLDDRIEQAVSRTVCKPVDRCQVVEIGNLAAAVPGTAPILFAALAVTLYRAGVHWVACTATPQVRAILDQLDFPTQTICRAEASALGEKALEWGAYYASCPQVLVGDTRVAAMVALGNPVMQSLIGGLVGPIDQAAAALRSARRR
jgi:hypothetical protein